MRYHAGASRMTRMTRTPHPAYPEPCGWTALLPPRTPRRPAEGRITARVAVVGAGYTGLAAARRLAEADPSAEIVVLEATDCGQGSAARNSGFASPRDIPASAAAADIAHTAALNRLTEEGFAWLEAICAAHGIDCGLRRAGRIKAAATAAGAEKVRALAQAARELGVAHAVLDTEALHARIGTRYYRTGVFTEEGHLLNPAALIQGLADALPPQVRLHEHSPVLALERGAGWVLRTARAEIHAETVVLATNAAVKHFGWLRDRLVTIHTYAALTEAMRPQDAAQLGCMADWGVLPAHRLGTTVRRVGAERLMVRSLYAYEASLPGAQVRAALTACFHRRYPTLSHLKLEHVWGGTTALTMNGSPFWGQLAPGLYASAGCNGAGIVKGTLLGKRLAELIAGHGPQEDVTRAYGTANRIAPEPFRRIGFHIVSAIERRRAGAEM